MRDPGSLWSPLPEAGEQGNHTKTQFIVHSTGDRGSAAAIYKYFSRPDIVVESTFVIGLGPEDPTRQMLDSTEYADANLNANGPAISVETVGKADDPFTEWQISELIRLGRWARANHPIAARICRDANDSGLGWHVMWGAPGPWTPVAKDCPGKVRIAQLKDRVFPAIIDGEDQDLTPDQDHLLREIYRFTRGVDPNVDALTLLLMNVQNAVTHILAIPRADLDPEAVAALKKIGDAISHLTS